MKNKFYLHEFKLFDGEEYITFNIVALNNQLLHFLRCSYTSLKPA